MAIAIEDAAQPCRHAVRVHLKDTRVEFANGHAEQLVVDVARPAVLQEDWHSSLRQHILVVLRVLMTFWRVPEFAHEDRVEAIMQCRLWVDE